MAFVTSGQRLMCVWQAVAMLDPGHSAVKSTARKLSVQDVTRSLARMCPSASYSDRIFMDNFPNASVDFNDYVNYVKVCLRDHSIPMATLEDEFEINCWEMCKDCYSLHHCSMKEGEVFKVWQIFNRLCVQGTIPPVMDYDDVQWLGQKFAKGAKQRWSSCHDGQLTFMEALLDFDSNCFKILNHTEVERVVDSVHGWLVREICLTGWMTKRTRKQANWTSWQRRWFVLKPGLLSYYTTPALAEKKGDIIISSKSRVDELDDLKTLIRHYPNRFRITNAPFIEIELSNDEYSGKDAWMRAVRTVIKAVKAGISPSEYMLSDIRKLQRGERLSSLEETGPGQQIMDSRGRGRSDGFDDESEDDVDGARHSGASGSTGNFDEDSETDHDKSTETTEDASWLIPLVMTQISEKAEKISEAEDGNLDSTEFNQFLKELGIILPEVEEQNLFDNLNAEGHVQCEVFLEFFLKVLLFSKAPEDSVSREFFISCLKAYDNSSNMLNLSAFTEALWRMQRIRYVHQMMCVLDSLDGQSGTLTDLRCAFSREQSVLSRGTEEKGPANKTYKEILHKATRVNVDQLAQYLHEKWNSYPLKTEATETKSERIPHEKTILDIVFHIDQDPEEDPPDCTRIDHFTWKRASKQGKSGTALLPSDFDGIIAVAEPTVEALAHYGASFATEQEQIHTALLYEHHIVSYRKLEREPFTRLIRQDTPALFCPLEEDSGLIVLGKQEGEALDLNAFSIPRFQTLYVPSGSIFCTSYMLGLWRTMVIHRAVCETAHVSQIDNEEGSSQHYESFQFM